MDEKQIAAFESGLMWELRREIVRAEKQDTTDPTCHIPINVALNILVRLNERDTLKDVAERAEADRDALAARAARFEAALRFYAEPDNWETGREAAYFRHSRAENDEGAIARAVLDQEAQP